MKLKVFFWGCLFCGTLFLPAAHCEKRPPHIEKAVPVFEKAEFKLDGGESNRISYFIRKSENDVLNFYKQALTQKGWQVLKHHNGDKFDGHGELQLIKGGRTMDIKTKEMKNGITGVTIRLLHWNPARWLWFFLQSRT